MKKRLRKIALLSSAIFFAFFSILVQPYENVKAAPVVIPAGMTAAAGVYTLTALGIAALIGPEKPELSAQMKEHAMNTWNSTTQLTKDAMSTMVTGATGTGAGVVAMNAEVSTYLNTQLTELQAKSMALLNGTEIMDDAANFSATSRSFNGGRMLSITTQSTESGYKNIIVGGYLGTSITMEVGPYGNRVQYRDNTGNLISKKLENVRSTMQTEMANATTPEQIIALFASVGSAVTIGGAAVYEDYMIGLNRTKELWEAMRDAGLVLPVDEFVPMSVDGQPLTYNPDTNVFTGADGQTYTGQVDWRIPNLRWREKSTDIPQAGVWVDLPTYVPELDADAPPADIPYTTTHITTGTTVGNPDYAVAEPVPVPTTPPPPYIPPFEDGGSSSLDFTPLMASGDVMSQKFPFSIPFDFVRQIRVFDVMPEAPVFQVRVPQYLQIEQISIPMNFDIDLTFFDPIATILRWGGVIVFDIGLIFAIRRFLPE